MSSTVSLGDGIAMQTIGDTIVTVWVKPASHARFDWWFNELKAVGNAHPNGAIGLSIITEGSSPPDGPLRKHMQDTFKALDSKLRRFVAVPVGNSVWLSIVRAMVRGILLVSGQSHRQVVANNVGEALSRVGEVAGADTPGRAALTESVRAICAALEIAAPPIV